jgi:hypothetical protein
MKEIVNLAGAYAGELIIVGVGIVIREIEKRILIRRKRKEWEQPQKYSKIN